MPNMDMPLPSLANDLRESPLPNDTKSTTDNFWPKLTLDRTLIDDPTHWAPASEILWPAAMLPPDSDIPLPVLMNARTESEEPATVMPAIEPALLARTKLRTERLDPNWAQFTTETL
jgi:hypothetical protein